MPVDSGCPSNSAPKIRSQRSTNPRSSISASGRIAGSSPGTARRAGSGSTTNPVRCERSPVPGSDSTDSPTPNRSRSVASPLPKGTARSASTSAAHSSGPTHSATVAELPAKSISAVSCERQPLAFSRPSGSEISISTSRTPSAPSEPRMTRINPPAASPNRPRRASRSRSHRPAPTPAAPCPADRATRHRAAAGPYRRRPVRRRSARRGR